MCVVVRVCLCVLVTVYVCMPLCLRLTVCRGCGHIFMIGYESYCKSVAFFVAMLGFSNFFACLSGE